MKKKVTYILLAILILVLLILIGGSIYLLRYSLTPNIQRDTTRSFERAYRSYPYLENWVDSLNSESALRDTFIINREGKRLHSYYISASEPTAKTAMLIHGYTDNAISMLMLGHLYNREWNYNVFLPDLQYHGLSEGRAIQMGWKDRLDVMEWMDVANHLYGDSARIVVHGISMGAATTMMVSGEDVPDYVRCFVEDCGYTSVWDEFSQEIQVRFNLPVFPLLYTGDWLCRIKYGWGMKEASSLEQVKKSRLPMYFIHGDEDTFVPTWMVYPLYEAKPGPKELWIVPQTKHAVAFYNHPVEYAARVKSFVDKYIP